MKTRNAVVLGLLVLVLFSLEISLTHAELGDTAVTDENQGTSEFGIFPIRPFVPPMPKYTPVARNIEVVLTEQIGVTTSVTTSTTTNTVIPPPDAPDSPDFPDNDLVSSYLAWSGAGVLLSIIVAGLAYSKLPKPAQRSNGDKIPTA